MNELPAELATALGRVRSVGVITGAGVSVDSGLPTYRGKGGVYDDEAEGDRTIEDLSAETIAADPGRSWRRLRELARAALGARPSAAHAAIVDIERAVERFCLLTQNVDRLHQRAGSANVIDIHGDLTATRCVACGLRGAIAEILERDTLPSCEQCGGLVRPDVVLFGELLAMEKLYRIRAELLERPPDALIVAGTTALFPYIAEPVLVAAAAGRLTVEVNPEPTVLSREVAFRLRGTAGWWLPRLAAAISSGG